MRKGSGGAGGGAGLYNTAGLLHHHPLHHSSPGNMVQQQQRLSGGNQNGGGRIFVPSHHHPHGPLPGGPFGGASFNQSGLLLHHPPPPHHGGHPSHNQASQLHRAPPTISGSGGFQGAHLAHQNIHQHHQFGPVASSGSSGPLGSSLANSHYSFQQSSSGGGSGGGSATSHSSSSHSSSGGGGGGGGGDMPPVETVVARLETACRLLHGIGGNNTKVAEISSEIQILSEDLRRVGAMLENTYPEVLDRVMSSMRDASAQPCLPPSLRLAIFELVELRASKWMLPSDSSNYYRQRRNLNDAAADSMLEERSGRNSGGSVSTNAGLGASVTNGNNVSVIVTNCAGNNNNPVKPEVLFPLGGTSPPASTVETPPPPAKTYREEIVIKNSDSGKVMGVRGRRVHLIEAISDTIISFEKVAPTAKERVLSINGYSQQSINLAKQLIQETITRNASPVLEGMVLPSSTSSLGGDFPDIAGLDEAELGLKRLHLQSTSSTGSHGAKLDHHHSHPTSSHFSYTVLLGDHSIKILGDDLQYVQEAKMALDDYFLQKYPDMFCASNGIEDVEEEEGEDEDFNGFIHRYDRETLLSLSKVRTPSPDFSHLEPDIRGNIVLEKRREFDLEKFTRETSTSVPTSTVNLTGSPSHVPNKNAASSDI